MAATPLYIPIHLGFALAAAAHVITTRITYTVPAGKRAEIGVFCGTLGEPAGAAFNTVNVNLLVNGINQLLINNAGVAGYYEASMNGTIDLAAGETISITTVNTIAALFVFSGTIQGREYQ